MTDDRDITRLLEIGDPFADEASAPARPMVAKPSEPSPSRGRVRAMRIIVFVSALLYDAAWLALRNTRPDLPSLPTSAIALGLGIPLAAGALALGAATRRGQRGLGLSAAHIVALAMAAPAVFVMATLVAAPTAGGGDAFWDRALHCMGATAILAFGPLGLGLWVFRRAFVATATWRTAAVGVACGALAAATISLHCPVSSAWHVVVGHGTVMLVGGLIGAWVGRTLSRS
jgi:hypothetical protein